MDKPTFYVASKTWHAPTWRKLRADGHNIIASWIDERWFEPDGKTARSLDFETYQELWRACAEEPTQADFTILYAEPGDVMKGALVECGAALGAGKTVFQVGSCASLKAGDGSDASFTRHPRWLWAPSVLDAIEWVRLA